MDYNPNNFLGSCEFINASTPSIVACAKQFSANEVVQTAKNCFEFVRDEIKHSSDYKLNPITCRASDVLTHKAGYCYAKSHLLCALLRANEIPAGLCYQRLSIDGIGPPFSLHGLNAVYLPDYGWYRIDARGNRDDVDAQFDPPIETLAFEIVIEGEYNLPEIHQTPLPAVTNTLLRHTDWKSVYNDLPDVP